MSKKTDDGVYGEDRTEEVRAFVFTYMKDSNGRAPTVREIGAGVSAGPRSGNEMAPSVVKYHLNRLVSRGILQRIKDADGRVVARGLEIVGSKFFLPEEIARAGEPLLMVEHKRGPVTVEGDSVNYVYTYTFADNDDDEPTH